MDLNIRVHARGNEDLGTKNLFVIISVPLFVNVMYIIGVHVHQVVCHKKVRGCLHDTGATFAPERVTPVPSRAHGSIFVYMIPQHHKMSCRRESPRRKFTPVLVPGREFHSCTKSRSVIM